MFSINGGKYIGFLLGKHREIYVFIHRCPRTLPGGDCMIAGIFPMGRGFFTNILKAILSHNYK